MPRFSVIVPAYQVQAYLPACLESVLSQSFPDFELIAVDDASPDACGDIVDEFAARDPRVRPVHLPANQGLGPARNAGMSQATGDYLVFLDGDDTLTPGALRAVADRLKETGEPDVLVYDYARTYWTGETVRNQAAARLTEDGPAPFTLTDRPGLLNLLMVAWNKTCRREFVERAGFTFPPGLYEDTPWTYPVLLRAESIATLDLVCVHYRQRRRGSILGTSSERHLDVFAQYDRVFAFLDSDPELARWRPVLFRRMADHLAVVFARPERLPRGSRAEFLRRARAHLRRYRVPGARAPLPVRLRHGLLRLGLHRTYRTLRLAAAGGRRALKLTTRTLRAVRSGVLRLHYRTQRLLPLRADRALFAARAGQEYGGYGGNPGALEEAFRSVVPHLRTAWLAAPALHHTVPPGPRRLSPGSARHLTELARAKYLVHDTPFDPRLVKRRGQVLVQTQAGTPLGHEGLDLQERPAAARDTDFAALLRDVDRWDYVLSANRHSTLTWQRVHPGDYTVVECGQPRTDVFHRATAADVTRLRELLGVPADSVAILYAPARRDYRRTQRLPLDLERVTRRLGPRFVVLVRSEAGPGAPQIPRAPRVVDVTAYPRLSSLCLASDVLVTDYAPLMVDYAALDRPIVLHTADQQAYEAARGLYVDLRAVPPGVTARDEDELIDIFATGHWRGSRAEELRSVFRERFCPWDDGRAAERAVRRIVLGERAPQPVVPLGERRPAPAALSRVPVVSAAVSGVPAPTGSADLAGRIAAADAATVLRPRPPLSDRR
ncbi:bifunctional glycosyltransferase/CDP-glycerol:glycerophosphate glycerophosphotransferase [Streptomyces sp. JW3]|uniref:bifunctional glycosyltransferase/CDP-glycerol:glycerophosphate glycerophosphotransferase n=1 Tax=Streptomyces sp. JW3 TaxID=3456955 RepID=UPI003FA40528